jgi:hypothetical protein
MNEEEHKKNFETIKKYNLKVGTKLINKETKEEWKIYFIHSLYGWIITHKKGKPHLNHSIGLDDINKFEIDNKELIIKNLK